MNRREFLKIGAVAGATISVPAVIVASGSAPAAASLTGLDAEVESIAKYREHFVAVREDWINSYAVDVKVAGMLSDTSRNGKYRRSGIMAAPPRSLEHVPNLLIPMIHDTFCKAHYSTPQHEVLADVLQRLTDRLQLLPEGLTVTNSVCITVPYDDDEHVTCTTVQIPRYSIDIDELRSRVKGPCVIANMLLDAVVGVWGEWQLKIDEAVNTVARTSGRPAYAIAQATPIRPFVRREGFRLEFTAWNVGGGYAHPIQVTQGCCHEQT